MESNNYFSLNRVFILFNRQLQLNYKSWLIAIGAISGLLLFISLLASYRLNNYSPQLLNTLSLIILFVGGYIFSSQVFSELNDRIRGLFYLTLPASSLEKLFVSWLISSIGFVAVIMTMLVIVSLIASGIAGLFTDTTIQAINPFNKNFLRFSGIYLVTQSVFLLGAVYFQKFNFLKTLLALYIIYFILSIWAVIWGYLLFHDFNFDYFMTGSGNVNINLNNYNFNKYINNVFWWLMAPYLLVITYIRLNEREA